MQIANTTREYGVVARFFHWTMFVLLGLTTFLALSMETMAEADAEYTAWLHRSFGVLLLLLLTLRLAWKLVNPQPADPPVPGWMKLAARVLHWAFYPVIFVQIAAGIVLSQADGAAATFFGLFTLPAIVAVAPEVHEFWKEVHETGWLVLTAMVVAHVAAALHHHFGDKDDVFDRMWILRR